MSEPWWIRNKDYVDSFEYKGIATIYYRKRCKAMDTVWWFLTGKAIEKAGRVL